MQNKKLPIGYFLKLAHDSLTKAIDGIQSHYGFNRTEWQILNSIQETISIQKQELINLLKPFADNQKIETILNELTNKNLIQMNNSQLKLTMEGKELYQKCFEMQKEFRKKSMNGISETQYQTTITTLERIIQNIN